MTEKPPLPGNRHEHELTQEEEANVVESMFRLHEELISASLARAEDIADPAGRISQSESLSIVTRASAAWLRHSLGLLGVSGERSKEILRERGWAV